MELKLNIYDDQEKVIKTYRRDTYSIKMGLLKRIVNIFETDDVAKKIVNGNEITSTLSLVSLLVNLSSGSYFVIEELMLKVFPELTEEEYENVSFNEVVTVIKNLFINSFNSISRASDDTKN